MPPDIGPKALTKKDEIYNNMVIPKWREDE